MKISTQHDLRLNFWGRCQYEQLYNDICRRSRPLVSGILCAVRSVSHPGTKIHNRLLQDWRAARCNPKLRALPSSSAGTLPSYPGQAACTKDRLAWYGNVVVEADNQLCFARVHAFFYFQDNAPQAFVQWYVSFNPSSSGSRKNMYVHPASRCMACARLDTSRTAFGIIPLEQLRRPVWLVRDLDVKGRYWAPNGGAGQPLNCA
jgi:hypothetical protein